MERIKTVGLKATLTTALVIAVTASFAMAQGANLESLFIGGGYDDDIKPGAKKEAAEPVMEETRMEADDSIKSMDLVMGKDLTRSGLTDDFFMNPDKLEPITYQQMLETAGYLSESIDSIGEVIDGEPGNQSSFSTEDIIYIDQGEAQGAAVGSLYLVYHLERPGVVHPINNRSLGFKVAIDGVVEVLEVNMDLAKAKVIRSYSGIERGDKITKYSLPEMPAFDPDRPVPVKAIEGYVVSSKDPKEGYATGDIVYLDVGQEAGAEPGDVFDIIDSSSVLRKDGKVVDGLPKLIGKATVILTQKATSTAFITKSKDAIYAGYKISYSTIR